MAKKLKTLTVNNNTRASKTGKVIHCPDCLHEVTVYHFSWVALECPGCGAVDKGNWVIDVPGFEAIRDGEGWNVQFLGDGTQDWFATEQKAVEWINEWHDI
jgi:hypothetical protein